MLCTNHYNWVNIMVINSPKSQWLKASKITLSHTVSARINQLPRHLSYVVGLHLPSIPGYTFTPSTYNNYSSRMRENMEIHTFFS